MKLTYGMNEPTTPDEAGFEMALENSLHSLTRSLSTKPAKHIASVRGLISDLMNSRMDACTPTGGGGGVGGGRADTPVFPGGGGLQGTRSQCMSVGMHTRSTRSVVQNTRCCHPTFAYDRIRHPARTWLHPGVHVSIRVVALCGDKNAALVVVSRVVEGLSVETGPMCQLSFCTRCRFGSPKSTSPALAVVSNHAECFEGRPWAWQTRRAFSVATRRLCSGIIENPL